MRRFAALVVALLLALPGQSWAAISYDTMGFSAQGTGNLSWTHTPSATPRGALVVCGYASATNQITAAPTYGGTAMTEVNLSPVSKATTEVGTVHAFFVGGALPAGAQTIVVTVSGAASKRCISFTVTAADDTSVEGTDTLTSDALDDPSDTVTTGAGVSTFVLTALLSGFDSTTGGVEAGSGYTFVTESDIGTMTFNTARRTAIATGGSVTYSWTTDGAEDVIMIAVAIKEGVTPPGGACAGRMALLGVGC